MTCVNCVWLFMHTRTPSWTTINSAHPRHQTAPLWALSRENRVYCHKRAVMKGKTNLTSLCIPSPSLATLLLPTTRRRGVAIFPCLTRSRTSTAPVDFIAPGSAPPRWRTSSETYDNTRHHRRCLCCTPPRCNTLAVLPSRVVLRLHDVRTRPSYNSRRRLACRRQTRVILNAPPVFPRTPPPLPLSLAASCHSPCRTWSTRTWLRTTCHSSLLHPGAPSRTTTGRQRSGSMPGWTRTMRGPSAGSSMSVLCPHQVTTCLCALVAVFVLKWSTDYLLCLTSRRIRRVQELFFFLFAS